MDMNKQPSRQRPLVQQCQSNYPLNSRSAKQRLTLQSLV
ncbi:hypothetical protein SOHN41_02006 [Shewanella sp. HN-41]|nr:hypothetical protein SOHN41_02006 [Shewanella sp. HN-41]